jgi:hypothetical protein
VLRNPGGRAADAIKSLAILQGLLNPLTIVVMHHTGKPGRCHWHSTQRSTKANSKADCGMTHVTDKEVQDYLIQHAPDEKEEILKTKFGQINREE